MSTAEHRRLAENAAHPNAWHRWGPYVSERQWGTVREDYSPDGAAWDYFSHDQARSRAYRWGEDGIGGFSDRHGLLNFTIAVWNHKDPILKERLFGLTNSEGNHGEDVKELYYYLDALPTHSYLKMLYRYPQVEFPYEELIRVNRERGIGAPEYEVLDTGVFDENRFFDVQVEFAKADVNDFVWRITVTNCGPETAPVTIVPQVTARNKWSWSTENERPLLALDGASVVCDTPRYGRSYLHFDPQLEPIFTENESNCERLFGTPNPSPFVKDAFHRLIVNGEAEAVNPAMRGTKVGFKASCELRPGESRTFTQRYSPSNAATMTECDHIVADRISEADEFYREIQRHGDEAARRVQRQAFAGLIWSKQYYNYEVESWAHGDAGQPQPPMGHGKRNAGWGHFNASEVLSMPDKWEYPWFASWDLAFHTIPFALIDANFAKDQLLMIMREWYMHPNGQIPAYEWAFSDVNPPVHAWAAHRVFRIERRLTGTPDYDFLERAFHKLLLNFTWWTNRKDAEDNNVFEGGFLGLDNIGVFDRNQALEGGLILEQSDGTSWMAMFCLNMLGIAIELTEHDSSYEEVASKFFEHFVYIASAMHKSGMWNDEDGFYYDILSSPNGSRLPVKLRSMVGLLPITACVALDQESLDRLPRFRARMDWFIKHRPELASGFAWVQGFGEKPVRVFSLVTPARLTRILTRLLDENEFLSPFGVRALSKVYDEHPFVMTMNGHEFTVNYCPAESNTGLFGGNSNWRGPVWFPVNYLLIEALQRHGYFLGEDWKVECPTGSGQHLSLLEVAAELSRRSVSLFMPNESGKRPVHEDPRYATDPLWKDLVLFFEYFHSETGRGVGASHQTGWTSVVAKLIDQLGARLEPEETLRQP